MKLIEFSEINQPEYENYIREWEASRELIVPAASKRIGSSFQEQQKIWREHQTDIMFEKGYVPATLYFYIEDNTRIVGAIHFRHELNDRILRSGGHIGYGIRPSARGKGYAAQMLSEMLNIIWQKGYEKVLITCDDDNLASVKTIEKNGGQLWDKPVIEGTLTKRYWIYR